MNNIGRFTIVVPQTPGKVTIDQWAVGEPTFFIDQEFDSVEDAIQAIMAISSPTDDIEIMTTIREDAYPSNTSDDLPF